MTDSPGTEPLGTEPGGAQSGNGPFNRQQPWATWWIWLWGVVAGGLLLSICLEIRFYIWLPVAVVGFGTMEGYGLSSQDDSYPPLTQVVREYVPRWGAFGLIFFFGGLAGGTWFHVHYRWWLALLVGLMGWLIAHFDVTFDSPATTWEHTKYVWYANKFHIKPLQNVLKNAEGSQGKPTYLRSPPETGVFYQSSDGQ